VWALAALSESPNLVRYYHAWVEADLLYIQTELCEGGNLHKYVEAGVRLPETQLTDILRQLAIGVHHVHQKNLVHLDIKPDNIYEKSGVYKLGDFGLCMGVSEDGTDGRSPLLDVSEGDSRYLAREILTTDGHSDLLKADIFALGCTIYELYLARALPTSGDEWQRIRSGHLVFEQPIAPALETLIRQMMHADAAQRPTIEQVLNAPILLQSQSESALRNEVINLQNTEQELRYLLNQSHHDIDDLKAALLQMERKLKKMRKMRKKQQQQQQQQVQANNGITDSTDDDDDYDDDDDDDDDDDMRFEATPPVTVRTIPLPQNKFVIN
jgi:serine/threonine protein kinase